MGSLIGLVADTHDNIHLIDRAVRLLNEEAVELVLHAGDYVSPFTVSHFKPLKTRLVGVYGNNCAEQGRLRGLFAEVEFGGARIALVHGHEEALLQSLVRSCGFDVVVHGHTHEARVSRVGGTLVVNPGEVCGYLSGRSTVGLLDVDRRDARIVDVE